jgi:hypothetical protein
MAIGRATEHVMNSRRFMAHPQTEDHNPITFSKRERCALQQSLPPMGSFGSFASDMIVRIQRGMSASPRKRTNGQTSH